MPSALLPLPASSSAGPQWTSKWPAPSRLSVQVASLQPAFWGGLAMADVQALQTALTGQDAAIYAYGLVAAQLSGPQLTASLTAMASHRARRDALRSQITAAYATPVPAAVAYDPPFPIADAASAVRLAALIEDRCAAQFAALAAAYTGSKRTAAALISQECATRCVYWSGTAPIWFGTPG